MPMELQIIRASEFVRLGARNHFNFEASKEALALLAMACRKRGIDRALLDLRELPVPSKPVFSPSQLAALVGTFREAGFSRNQKLAVLYRSDPHHGARMFAFISTLRGWQVKAFDDFEKTVLWLSDDSGQRREPGEQPVPLQMVKPRMDSRLRVERSPERPAPGRASSLRRC